MKWLIVIKGHNDGACGDAAAADGDDNGNGDYG